MRQQLWDKTAIIFAVGIFLTFVAFDVIWCMDTTFASFSFFETYATKIIATLALAGVYALTRCRWAQIVVMALLDVLLVANLMYFRTYYSAIPASSYLEAGNLADFKASVTDSLRWADIVLPLITIATAVMAFRYKTTKRQPLTAVLNGGQRRLQASPCCSRASICAKEASTSRCAPCANRLISVLPTRLSSRSSDASGMTSPTPPSQSRPRNRWRLSDGWCRNRNTSLPTASLKNAATC